MDNIEDNLNNFPTDWVKVLNAILNTVVKNQALLEALMDIQLTVMDRIDPGFDPETFAKQVADATSEHLAIIQADIASKLL
jgi:hypothetical protein